MDDLSVSLAKRFGENPAYLLLGQSYLRIQTGSDLFLDACLAKYRSASSGAANYDSLLETEFSNSTNSALEWMQQLCSRLTAPDYLKVLASVQWNGVFSSAIDTLWEPSFANNWRTTQPVYSSDYAPPDIASRRNLHCTYLFGSVKRTDVDGRTPLTRAEWYQRKFVADRLVARLPELVSPFGTLVIEGYCGKRDWLNVSSLLPIIYQFSPNQVHIFSMGSENDIASELTDAVSKQIVTLHEQSLASFLQTVADLGFLDLGVEALHEEKARRISVRDKALCVPLEIWSATTRSAQILDDAILAPPKPISEDARYFEFRDFLAYPAARSMWTGFHRGYAFRREFENTLSKKTADALTSGGRNEKPLILHGQTGTGKTIALGSLAFALRIAKDCPVLYIPREAKDPQPSEIDAFCQWIENEVGQSTVVIWDGMRLAREYAQLMRYLTSRGRKVILVGSAYRCEPEIAKLVDLVEAPACLSEVEAKDFRVFLSRLVAVTDSTVATDVNFRDPSFLVALYRILPATRARLGRGVHDEVVSAEASIRRRISDQVTSERETVLSAALWKAGITEAIPLLSEHGELPNNSQAGVQKLVGLVMVPGRFGLKIPLDLLMRCMKPMPHLDFVTLLRDLDIFRWEEDSLGQLAIGPRHPLEAEILLRRRLGGARFELDFVKQILFAMRDSNEGKFSSELDFVIDLLRSIGPNGPNEAHYRPYFLDMARILLELREARGIPNPRLMLQEATLLRESSKDNESLSIPVEQVKKRMEDAQAGLLDALRLVESSRNTALQAQILVELAACAGTRFKDSLRRPDDTSDRWALFRIARDYAFRARTIDSDSEYPIDVFAWTAEAFLREQIGDPEARAEVEADLLYLFESTESQFLGAAQTELLHKRRLKIGDLIGKSDISDDAFEKLCSLGSCAGYLIRASGFVRGISRKVQLDSGDIECCQRATDYLEASRAEIAKDFRCLSMLLQNWWKTKTGKPLFHGERQTVPFTQSDWLYVQGIIADMRAAEGALPLVILFIEAIALFHLNEFDKCFELFRRIGGWEGQSYGRRRIIRSYLASTPTGEARQFHGTVAWVDHERFRGEVFVEEIGRTVAFLPRDFARLDIAKHDVLAPTFQIAFNFIGPIAAPVSATKKTS